MVELEISPGRVYPSSGGGAKARPRKGAESCHVASNSQHTNPQRRKAIYYSAMLGSLLMTGYLASIRDSVRAARDERSPPIGALTAVVYACVLAYLAFWLAVRPDSKWFSHYFREGSPVDMLSTTFLGTGAALAGVALVMSRHWRSRVFWLLCTLGSLFLMLDERLQLHEQAHGLVGGGAWGPPLFGLRSWNDVIMLGYGVVALVLGLVTLPAFLRHRRVRALLMTGFGFFVLHTAIDMSFKAAPLKDIFEEPCKLLAGASFMLAFMNAAMIELREHAEATANPVGQRANGLGWAYPAVFLALAAGWSWLVTEPSEDLRSLLWLKWGYPHRWLTAVYLQLAAITIFAASFPGRATALKTSWQGLPLVAGLWFLSIGEAMNACRYRFAHDRVEGDFLPSLRKKIDVLHNDLEPIHWLTLAGLMVAVAIGATLWRKRPPAAWWLGLGLVTLIAALVVNVVTDGMAREADHFGEHVLSPWLRVMGSACVALGGLSLFARANENDGDVG